MPPTRNNLWRRIRTPLLLYTLLAAFLLWLLPPPIHFQFTSDKTGRLFKPISEPALVRVHTEKQNAATINDYFIEHIDLCTGNTKRIALDPGDRMLSWARDCQISLNGSVIKIINQTGALSLWDGHTGKLHFVRNSKATLTDGMGCFAGDSRIALITGDDLPGIDIIDARTEENLCHYSLGNGAPIVSHRCYLKFSLDGRWLICNYASDTPNRNGPDSTITTELFDTYTLTSLHRSLGISATLDEAAPTLSGFWLMQWNRSEEKITLSYLDAPTGKLTTLAPELSRRLDGFPHIFSDNAGHLYLLQNCKPDTNNWQHRTRQTILTWLKHLGIDWETTDTIHLRQISPDGKRILREQTFAANYAEISPDGNYLILMSQMKNESKYFIYRYPIQLNWLHALSWPAIPTLLLVFLRRRQNTSPLPTGERGQG